MGGDQLRVTKGKERGKRLSLDGDLLIGRAASHEDGRLGDDPEISRRHARFSREADGHLRIEDLGSANGTYVNGERIDGARRLALGDLVRMGKTMLQVTDRSGAVPEKPPPAAEPSAAPAEPASVPAEAAVELVVTAGTAPGERLTVRDELILGRAASGAGRLSDDPRVSRRHARIVRDSRGQLAVEDLGSNNGTLVNGEPISGRRVLNLGDAIQVGSTTLTVSEVEQAPAPRRPAAPEPGSPPDAAQRRSPEAAQRRPPPPAVRRAPDPAVRRAPDPAVRRAPDPAVRRPPAPGRAPVDRPQPPAPLPPGSVFAGCRLDQIIGHGDMGVVYRAEELALQRRLALKLILREHSRDERFRERFRRESNIAAAIDHPNVIPIFDAGEEDGVLFITMRLVEGTDLRAVIAAEGRIPPLRAARIIRQVASALDAAHARGMVHRDVKPANVLLAQEDHVYLSDFGLAKRATAAGGLTRKGSIVARAEYVAPEQILDQRVDARADIYALGCMLFEALTGEPPFVGWEGGPQALAHLDAPRPSPVEVCPDLPREFDDVVQRAMATDPDQRYPSAGDLGQAALVAAGGLRRARRWSMVAVGEAAPRTGQAAVDERAAGAPVRTPTAPAPAEPAPQSAEPQPEPAGVGRSDVLRWSVALAGLIIVFVGMITALNGIATL
jgi:pSer/pThr/pTyr-binding forkhead associated (FHA) protein